MPRRSPAQGLTALQLLLGNVFFAEPVSEGFAVTGEAAFAAYRFNNRQTRDMYLVGQPDQSDIGSAAAHVRAEMRDRDFLVQEVPGRPHSQNLLVEGLNERMLVSLSVQQRYRDVSLTVLGPTLHPDDLLWDTMVRLVAVGEPLFLQDLRGWVQRFTLDHLLELARQHPVVSPLQVEIAVDMALTPAVGPLELDGDTQAFARELRDRLAELTR